MQGLATLSQQKSDDSAFLRRPSQQERAGRILELCSSRALNMTDDCLRYATHQNMDSRPLCPDHDVVPGSSCENAKRSCVACPVRYRTDKPPVDRDARDPGTRSLVGSDLSQGMGAGIPFPAGLTDRTKFLVSGLVGGQPLSGWVANAVGTAPQRQSRATFGDCLLAQRSPTRALYLAWWWEGIERFTGEADRRDTLARQIKILRRKATDRCAGRLGWREAEDGGWRVKVVRGGLRVRANVERDYPSTAFWGEFWASRFS